MPLAPRIQHMPRGHSRGGVDYRRRAQYVGGPSPALARQMLPRFTVGLDRIQRLTRMRAMAFRAKNYGVRPIPRAAIANRSWALKMIPNRTIVYNRRKLLYSIQLHQSSFARYTKPLSPLGRANKLAYFYRLSPVVQIGDFSWSTFSIGLFQWIRRKIKVSGTETFYLEANITRNNIPNKGGAVRLWNETTSKEVLGSRAILPSGSGGTPVRCRSAGFVLPAGEDTYRVEFGAHTIIADSIIVWSADLLVEQTIYVDT